MKNNKFFATLAAAFALFVGPAVHAAERAATVQTGTISGRVQNEVTGRYLNNSRITVKGTDIRVLTDESGSYRLTNVPSGTIVLEAFYSGLEKQEISVDVAPGQSVTQNVNLVPPGVSTVRMDPFVVDASKAMDQSTIAINEQRFAPNIKTVVSTGDLSEHVDGNIAEFLKFVPGISTDDSVLLGASTISVRGFPDNLTQVNLDGAQTSNAPISGTTRRVETRLAMSVTNIARVEVTKVPTPSTGADTMAGSVNLVTRNAFESARREFRYTLTVSGQHKDVIDTLSFKKKYSLWDDKEIYYAVPSLSFTHTHPVNNNFGYTISGMYDSKRMPNLNSIYTHNFNSPTFGATPSAPALTAVNIINAGLYSQKAHTGATADWRVTPNSVLSSGVQMYKTLDTAGGYRVTFNTGANANPTVAGGVPGSYGPDHTIGATGRGTVSASQNGGNFFYKGIRANLRYKFDNGVWRADLKASRSGSSMGYRDLPLRGIRQVGAQNANPLRVEFHDIDPVTGPGQILVFNNAGEVVDTSGPSFHEQMVITQATGRIHDVGDYVSTYGADIRRRLDLFAFPAAVQVGGARKIQERDSRTGHLFTFRGYNGPGGDQSVVPYLTPPYNLPGVGPHVLVSPYKALEAWNNNPSLFFELPADRVARERRRRLESELIKETADALYLQAEARFLDNRLNVVTGVRYEKTRGEGQGFLDTPDGVWRRNADGSFVLSATGARVRKPEAGAPGSLEELDFTSHERAARSSRTYDGYYPSVHLTYNFTEKLQSRAAYAKTYGRPNFSFVIPRTVVQEFSGETGDVTGGRLTVRNSGLKPWTADNYDLTTEYYTDQGGILGANVFRKEVSNFFGSETRDATAEELAEAGISPGPGEPWELRTTENVGNARIDGLELSVNQSLSPLDPWLGGWGNNFRVFGNITKIKVNGDRTADFSGFLPTSANWGIQFARKRVAIFLKWNYRSEQQQGAVTTIGPNGFNTRPSRLHLDVNASYSLRPNLKFFIQARNVTREIQNSTRKSDVLPAYAKSRDYLQAGGSATNIGISGSF